MRRVKMNLPDMYLLNIEYHAFQRIKHPEHGYGVRYVLCKPLNDQQIAAVIKFKNTIMGNCQYRYAPEIKYDTLILYDKCI